MRIKIVDGSEERNWSFHPKIRTNATLQIWIANYNSA